MVLLTTRKFLLLDLRQPIQVCICNKNSVIRRSAEGGPLMCTGSSSNLSNGSVKVLSQSKLTRIQDELSLQRHRKYVKRLKRAADKQTLLKWRSLEMHADDYREVGCGTVHFPVLLYSKGVFKILNAF